MNEPWQLIDGEARNTHNPLTFHMPPLKERAACKLGQMVKIGVVLPEAEWMDDRPDGERFWVEIISQAETGEYKGKIANDLVHDHGLQFGQEIKFFPKHILQTNVPPAGAQPPPMRHRPLVFTDVIRKDIARVIEAAKAKPYDLGKVLRIMKRPQEAPRHNPDFVTNIPFGFRCVFTHEQQPIGWCRHLSVSIGAKRRLPHPVAIEEIMKAFGFKRGLEELGKAGLVHVMNEDVDSVNILELIDDEKSEADKTNPEPGL